MKSSISVENAKQMINDKLSHFFGVTPEDATEEQYYKAVAMIVRDDLAAKNSEFRHIANGQDSKKIYYLCMEFLMGRSLKNNLYNLNLTDVFDKALSSFGVSLNRIYELEPDAGLGNGASADLPLAILTALPQTAISQWAIQSAMRQAYLSKSLLTAGKPSCPISGFPAAMFGLFPVKKEALRLSLKAMLRKAGTAITIALSKKIATR